MDLLRLPKDPSRGGGLDHGSAGQPSRPLEGGSLGPWMSRDPRSLYEGGVLQNDFRMTFVRLAPERRGRASNRGRARRC